MTFTVSAGEVDFELLRKEKAYYVDKTDIIYELVNNTKNKVTLFTRPRRFGKTLMLSMMENFFSIRKNSKEIFEGLSITKHKEFCDRWMNQYPVLFISFKDIDGKDFKGAYGELKNTIANLCKNISDILNCKSLDKDDVDLFSKLKSKTALENDVTNFLVVIIRMLHAVYNKKVILLIDEYDVPIAKASDKGYYDSMLPIIKRIMSVLKDNELLQFAVITGCQRIVKESIFTGTNNFVTYSILDDKFSSYFGFLQEEVDTILKTANRINKKDLIKEWYDGYLFGNTYIYCPWDVINYVSALNDDPDAIPKNYWKNTSHNEILLDFAKRTDFDVSEKFETLLRGETIKKTISDTITYETIHSSEDNLWSVLLMTGYITKADPNEKGNDLTLKIPNKEIVSIFEDTVIRLFQETIDISKQKAMMEALWNGDEVKATNFISDLLWKTISYHDYHEDYYHAFLSGIFVGLGYDVNSNKEAGLGRPDIQLLDRNNRRLLIIEAKKSLKEEDMDFDCQKAIDQIIEKGYNKKPTGYKNILCYGISFYQKQAKVKLATKECKDIFS